MGVNGENLRVYDMQEAGLHTIITFSALNTMNL